MKQLKEQQGITEQLKADDMMVWVQAMNCITNQSREIVYNEVIYITSCTYCTKDDGQYNGLY